MRKHNLIFAALLVGFSSCAFSQPIIGMAPAASASSASSAPHVDPFNGQPLSIEQARMELDQEKLKTQALEEQLKQAQTKQDMLNLPELKAVNVSQAKTEVLNQDLKQFEIEQKIHTESQEAAQKRMALLKEKRAAARPQKGATNKPTAFVRAPAPQLPVLVSVSDSTDRSAVLQSAQGSYLVKDGQQTPFGQLKVLGPSEVRLGNSTLYVHLNTLSEIHAPYVPPVKSPNGSVARFPAQQGANAAGPSSAREIPPPVVARTVPGSGQVNLPFASR